MKNGKWFGYVLLSVIFCSIFLIPMSGTASAATKKHLTTSTDWESIVAKANPYIHITSGVATVDPQINQVLQSDEINLVQRSVDRYNHLPLSLRQHPHLAGTLTVHGIKSYTITGGKDAYRWAIDTYWWGVRMWINSPAAQNFTVFTAAAGAIVGGIIGNILGATVGSIVGGALGTVSGSLTLILDNQCGNKGVFIDINWLLQPSVNPVC